MEEVGALTADQVETFRAQDSESDSDDEPITLLRRRPKAGQLRLQADSDEDDDGAASLGGPSGPCVDPPETNSMDIEESNSYEEKSLPKAKTGKRRVVIDSSSDEDESAETSLKSYGFRNKYKDDTGEMDPRPNEVSAESHDSKEDLGTSAEGSPEEESESSLRNKILANSDLFDAEGSSGDEVECDNERDEDVSLDDIKKAARRSAKTKSSTLQPAKRRKPKKGEVQQLHSDSQRVVRQSRVSLPYHVPQQRTLDDFLNRRKNVPNVIKPSAKETESILKKLVKINQKPATSIQPVNIESSANQPENPELRSTPTNLEADISPANPEPNINLVKRSLDLESPVFELASPDTFQNPPSEAQKADGGDATIDLPPGMLPDAYEEDDLPDLVETDLNPLKLSEEPPCTVLKMGSCLIAAINSENSESNPTSPKLAQNLQTDSSTPGISCDERKTEVPLEEKLVMPASEQNLKLKSALEEVAAFKPKLSGAPRMIIDFDEEDHENVPPNGNMPLGKRPVGPHKVVLSILKKETDSSGEERLVNESFTVTLSDETRPNSQTPGSTLLCLKEKLKAEIARRRTEARQKRILMHAEDEEEGFEGDQESESEEEEILSDPMDSDEDDECEIIGKELKKPRKLGIEPKNEFIDEEAEDEDDRGSDTDKEKEEDDDEEMAEKTTKDKGVRLRLQLESDSSEDETPLPRHGLGPGQKPPLLRCSTTELFPPPNVRTEDPEEGDYRPPLVRDTSMETSFELLGSLVPAHQPGGGFKNNQMQVITPLKRHYSTLSLPVENSQDLFSQHVPAEEPHYPLSPFDDCAPRTLIGESPEPIIRPQLGLFEEDGISTQDNKNELYDLCSGKWADSAKSKTTNFKALCDPVSPKNTRETMAELMGLCSGKFICTESSNVKKAFGIGALCDPPSPKDTQGKMDQLWDLCSGKFTGPSKNGLSSQQTDFAENTGESQGAIRLTAHLDRSDDELSISSLRSTGPRVRRRPVKRILSDAESDDEDCSNQSDEEIADAESVRKGNKRMKEFFEDEAELSGSDVPSDEDDEIAEEDDILEEELGDLEYLAEDELKNQVEKVHMKMMMDDDQRKLRLYKEMYLEDGDLHSECQGRVRKFRWRNVDDDSNDDTSVFRRDSESEGEDGENDVENAAFRMKRHEREKWLSEHKKSHAVDHDALMDDAEANQFKALKKVNILRRSSSVVMKASNSPLIMPALSKQSPSCCGSFLARGKDALAKIAELTKGGGKDGLNGPRNSRNFVFSVVSPTKEAQLETPKLRRVASTPARSALPTAKKSRLEVLTPVPSNDSSIFDLL